MQITQKKIYLLDFRSLFVMKSVRETWFFKNLFFSSVVNRPKPGQPYFDQTEIFSGRRRVDQYFRSVDPLIKWVDPGSRVESTWSTKYRPGRLLTQLATLRLLKHIQAREMIQLNYLTKSNLKIIAWRTSKNLMNEFDASEKEDSKF